MDIQRDGGGYKALDGGNLLASTDEWMSPIFADVGPDGAVWVIDFYSFVIQHNPTPSTQSAGVQATTGRGGAYMTSNNLREKAATLARSSTASPSALTRPTSPRVSWTRMPSSQKASRI